MVKNGLSLYPDPKDMNKLIEMGKRFHQGWQKEYDKDVWSYEKMQNDYSYIVCIYQDGGSVRIHWFEFLMRWIIPVLMYGPRLTKRICMSDTPIDDAYNEFRAQILEDVII